MKVVIKKFIICFVVALVITGIWGNIWFHKHRHFFRKPYPLYETGVPDKNGFTDADEKTYRGKIYSVTNNSTAKYFVIKPDSKKATGHAVIIAPGGGYSIVGYGNGLDMAKELADNGILAIVLVYRVPNHQYPNIPLEDMQNMIKLTRKNADEFGINPNKIGVMGLSAGGHLAAISSVHNDENSKPNFAILYYPVISMVKDFTHNPSKISLMGEKPDAITQKYYSPELFVNKNTPPTYIVHCDDDEIVDVKNSKYYSRILDENNVDNKLIIYPKCSHGWDWSSRNFKFKEQDKEALEKWIKAQ